MDENKLFGTDGIRTNINSFILNEKSVLKIGEILGFLLDYNNQKNHKRILIGQDTRQSGKSIVENLAHGLKTYGLDCHLIGVIPTGAISFITKNLKYDLGIMVSASHNPYIDNGIKIFNSDGYKISNDFENQIENLYFYFNSSLSKKSLKEGSIKTIKKDVYLDYLKNNFTMANKKIVVDCANGSACDLIAELLGQNKDIKIIGNDPNGENINLDVGSEYPDYIKSNVLDFKADIGIAFDGDADRVIFIDEKGKKVDGDAVLAFMAIQMQKNHQLKENKIVATVMSSPALDIALKPYNISVLRTDVGDKNVSNMLRDKNYNFGGEQSGHLVFHDHCPSGDGIIACLYFLNSWRESNKSISELFSFFKPIPSILKDIEVNKKVPLQDLPKTKKAIDEANRLLNANGRVFFRYSGTQLKARLLVEGNDKVECRNIAEDIANVFKSELNNLP